MGSWPGRRAGNATYPWKRRPRYQKYYYQAAFVAILKKNRKMAKERGLISPNDFAQLQKYMECESSFQSFSSGDLTPENPSSSF